MLILPQDLTIEVEKELQTRCYLIQVTHVPTRYVYNYRISMTEVEHVSLDVIVDHVTDNFLNMLKNAHNVSLCYGYATTAPTLYGSVA